MPEFVSIPISFFEVTAVYQHPNLRPWSDRLPMTQGLLDAFSPWGINIDNIEAPSTGKYSEQGIKLHIPQKRITFFFGPASCKFTRDDASWNTAEETLEILNMTLEFVKSFANVNFSLYKTVIALHVQPKSLRFLDLLKPFISLQLSSLSGSPLKTAATVVKWEDRGVTLDGSASIANGIFLKFERDFQGGMELKDIATQLRSDEQQLFEMIGITEEEI
jgi:hypothetical protein